MSARETKVPRAVVVMGATYVECKQIDALLVITRLIAASWPEVLVVAARWCPRTQPGGTTMQKKHLIAYPATALIALGIGASGGGDSTGSAAAGLDGDNHCRRGVHLGTGGDGDRDADGQGHRDRSGTRGADGDGRGRHLRGRGRRPAGHLRSRLPPPASTATGSDRRAPTTSAPSSTTTTPRGRPW